MEVIKMVKYGKYREKPICYSCYKKEKDENTHIKDNYPEENKEKDIEERKGADRVKPEDFKMEMVTDYEGNGNLFRCSRCGNEVKESPIDESSGIIKKGKPDIDRED